MQMRNRAKCKKCESIIESFHSTDYVTCKCDEISVSGGSAMRCAAKDFCNFMRVDDEGNEVVPKVLLANVSAITQEAEQEEITYDGLVNMLDEMIKNIERLPSHVMTSPITHYDFCSLMLLLSGILRKKKD